VWLVQNPLPCLPCQQEGCDRHLDSRAQCLDEMTPRQVLAAVDEALASGGNDCSPGEARSAEIRN
jgi:heptosyltransferase-3